MKQRSGSLWLAKVPSAERAHRECTCRKGPVIIEFICCGVCRASLLLDEQSVIAAAEVITFSEAHGLHDRWSLSFRSERVKSDRRIQCRRVPGAEGQSHTTVEGGGHFLQEDKGEELARVIVEFIG